MRKILLCVVLVVPFLAVPEGAEAVPFSTDVVISGSLTYDTGSAVEVGIANVAGALVETVGGVPAGSTFDGSVVTGMNPRTPLLTDFGDQIAMLASDVSAVAGQYAARAILGMTIENTSAVDSYEVALSASFVNIALASGVVSLADSRYSLVDTNGSVFASLVRADTSNGNVLGSMLTGEFGGTVTDTGASPLLYALAPGESVSLLGEWIVAGASVGEEAIALGVFVAGIQVDSVTQIVPEPSAALVLGLGLLALGSVVRRRA